MVDRFCADVVVCDNHFPPFRAAPRVCHMWHGLGWKARPRADVDVFYQSVARMTGKPPSVPNPLFRAQCYGEPDRAWRVERWGLNAENCWVVGMCFADLLRAPPYSKRDLVSHYAFDVIGRKTVLLNLTWHHGRMFPGRWSRWSRRQDVEENTKALDMLFDHVGQLDANVLMCLHDSHRYDSRQLHALQQIAARHPHVQLKHKDQHPDNLADLIVADVMVSNLSSFITYMYHLGRPTIHLCPAPQTPVTIATKRWLGGVKPRSQRDDADVWMTLPSDNGGMSVHTLDELISAIERGLESPSCCHAAAHDWVARHIAHVDGATGKRFGDALQEWVETYTVEAGAEV